MTKKLKLVQYVIYICCFLIINNLYSNSLSENENQLIQEPQKVNEIKKTSNLDNVQCQDSLATAECDQKHDPIQLLSQRENTISKRANMHEYIQLLPKAELHLHIEGTLEPEMVFALAKKNGIKIHYHTVEELRQAYNFSNLQSFLDIYYVGMQVLQTEQDFYDLTWAYFEKAHEQNVLHIELFFDPQGHTARGIEFGTVIKGIHRALSMAKQKFGMTGSIIICFLRHLSEEEAFQTLAEAMPYKDLIIGVGLDSSEIGYPPHKFERVFAKAKAAGFLTVAHAGEEGPVEYIWDALNTLQILRIDHGNSAINDSTLITKLAAEQIPLTMCPLSNYKLQVVKNLSKHPLRQFLQHGVLVTVNSDDPAYFGHLNATYIAIYENLHLTKQEIYKLVENSFRASFLGEDVKQEMLLKLQKYKPE